MNEEVFVVIFRSFVYINLLFSSFTVLWIKIFYTFWLSREFLSGLNQIWKNLAKKVPTFISYSKNVSRSIMYVPNGYFTNKESDNEFFYLDAYWIVRGINQCSVSCTSAILPNFSVRATRIQNPTCWSVDSSKRLNFLDFVAHYTVVMIRDGQAYFSARTKF